MTSDPIDHHAEIVHRVFNILEFGNELGEGPRGTSWSPDTLNAIHDVFARFGMTFTDPDDTVTPETTPRTIDEEPDVVPPPS